MSVRIAEVERAVARAFPFERAEPWDRVGLLAGDPEREVSAVALALDPTRAAVAFAREVGANVLLTHHPAFLDPPTAVKPGPGPGGVLFAALEAGVALINAHTNLDRDPRAATLLPDALGMQVVSTLERTLMAVTLVTVYVPPEHEDAVRSAMSAAGAGRIGEYEGCSFTGRGMGRFTPGPTATPASGSPEMASTAEEVRVEMVCARGQAPRIVAAAVAVHPYEEPLVTATEVAIARNAAGMGALCDAPAGMLLRDLAERCASAFSITPRVWGDRAATLARIVTATGSAGSLIPTALAAGADALVAGEVRYHDALDAAEAGLAIVEIGHDVSEWPLVSLLEDAVRGVEGLPASHVKVLPARPGWWTP